MKTWIVLLLVSILNCNQTSGQTLVDLTKEISDTTVFMQHLKEFCRFNIDTSRRRHPNVRERVNFLRRINIHGSLKKYLFIEYEYGDGSMSSYPWKYQILFDTSGRLIHLFWGVQFDFIQIFNDSPSLMIITSTSRGNGYHELFSFVEDSLVSVLNTSQLCVQTYDAGYDRSVNVPNVLNYDIFDDNKDGYDDLIFFGRRIVANNPDVSVNESANNSEIELKLVYLYDPRGRFFIPKQNYAVVYCK